MPLKTACQWANARRVAAVFAHWQAFFSEMAA
jgi:hypothetical protein